MRRCEQVATDRAVERPTVPAAPEADEYVFDDRLRGGERLDVAGGERREGAGVEADERLERLLVTASDPVDPLPILRHERQGRGADRHDRFIGQRRIGNPRAKGATPHTRHLRRVEPIAVSGRRLARTETRNSWPAEHEPGRPTTSLTRYGRDGPGASTSVTSVFGAGTDAPAWRPWAHVLPFAAFDDMERDEGIVCGVSRRSTCSDLLPYAGTTTMEPVRPDELTASGVSWAAVISGAFVAAAMALILLSL